ncbi:MAG: S9 family peptidase [Planctomycetes bacterium]|nr:S9 family peptidase [Planctomycetota bacterium]
MNNARTLSFALVLLPLTATWSFARASRRPVRPRPRRSTTAWSAPSAKTALTPFDVARVRAVTTAVVSPDGKHVAYVLSVPRTPMVDDDGANWTELWVASHAADGGAPRAYVGGKSDVSNVAWLPDSSAIAFTQKRGDDKASSLWVIALAGGEARKAVASSAGVGAFSFAPDGKRVAFLATEADSDARKKAKEKGFAQEIYEEDARFQRVFVATLFDDAAKPRALGIEGHVHQVRWSPVNETLLVSTAPTPLVDDQYMAQTVKVVDATNGKELARFAHEGKLGEIDWSPDGKKVAFLGGADLHDPNDARLFVADANGGKPVDLTAGKALDVDAFVWQSPEHLMAVVSQGLHTSIEKLPAARGDWKTIVGRTTNVFTTLSLSEDGQRGAFVANAADHPPELFTMSHGDAKPARRTESNPWLAERRLAKQEAITWKAKDGVELQGVLIRPLDEVPGQRYPLIVYVHGGPEAHEQDGWQTAYAKPGQVAAANGFAVFHPNYRGSTGRGVEFSELSQGDPAGKEFDDLVDAVDHLVSIGLVDPKRVGVTGGSYGGYATAWCSTRFSERFAAGVMFVGISNKVSKLGTTDIPNEEYLVHARHRVWEDWNFFLQRSPITYAGQSKTPLLILHGKDDPRVNPGQSRELYRHLKLRGQAPVRLVLYPGEGHGNRKCAAKLDYSLRMHQWFGHYLQGAGGAMPAWELDYAEPTAKKDA